MLFVNRINWLAVVTWSTLFLWCMLYAALAADTPPTPDARVICPNPGEPCKIMILSLQEERVLMQQNGVLDTAAQARNLDLGQFTVYFKTRIAASPNGEVKPVEKPAEAVKP